MNRVYGLSLPIAYHRALRALWDYGDKIPCPDYNTERSEIGIVIDVYWPLEEPRISKLAFTDPESLQQYCMEICDGVLDFEIKKGNWNYTYHDRIVKQIPFIIDELKRNPYSTRAVICVRTDDDIGSDDPACLQNLQFFIRRGALNMTAMFRSNDACKAAFMNMFGLIKLQEAIAAAIGVKVGTYTHIANSFHVYKEDYDMFEGYIQRLGNTHKWDSDEMTYNYEGDWKELMEECIPDIFSKVEVLKAR